MAAGIYITRQDRDRIMNVLDKLSVGIQTSDPALKKLETELHRAVVVDARQIDGNVVTMNTKTLLTLNGKPMEVSLVYPEDADVRARKLSLFSPIGTAILGYREGNTVEWEVPSGKTCIHIRKVLYQPEAAGDYHL